MYGEAYLQAQGGSRTDPAGPTPRGVPRAVVPSTTGAGASLGEPTYQPAKPAVGSPVIPAPKLNSDPAAGSASSGRSSRDVVM